MSCSPHGEAQSSFVMQPTEVSPSNKVPVTMMTTRAIPLPDQIPDSEGAMPANIMLDQLQQASEGGPAPIPRAPVPEADGPCPDNC